jgi:hypothetical protein
MNSRENTLEFVEVKFEEHVCNNILRLMVDTGAEVSIIDEHTYKAIEPRPDLTKKEGDVFAYQQAQPIDFLGKFTSRVTLKQKSAVVEFAVVKGKATCILGIQACKRLGIVRFTNTVNAINLDLKFQLAKRYPSVFSEKLGKFKGPPVRYEIDDKVKPVEMQFRRVPFSLHDRFEKAIQKMIDDDVIEPVQPGMRTDWVSPAMGVPKKNTDELRIVVDATLANKAIRRTRKTTPTIEEMMQKMAGATVFSKLDLRQGFHQFELAEESRHITTFSCHKNLFRYKRMSMGFKPSPIAISHGMYRSQGN